jgi:hypothetical protein
MDNVNVYFLTMVIDTHKKQRVKRPCPFKVKIALDCRKYPLLREKISNARSQQQALYFYRQWKKSSGRKSDQSRLHHAKSRSKPAITGALIPLHFTEMQAHGKVLTPREKILPALQPDEKNPAQNDNGQPTTLAKGVTVSPEAIPQRT